MGSIGERRLSMFPEEITTHILSLMPTKYAVRTTVLSRSWRYSWMLLKNLDIVVRDGLFLNAMKFIRGFPLLKSLSLKVIIWKDKQDYVFNIPTLKRLKLTLQRMFSSSSNKVVFNLPNLKYLYVGGIELDFTFVMEDVSSLVEASFSFNNISSHHLCLDFLKGIRGVESLSIHNSPLCFTSALPIFPNLKHLELTGFCHSPLTLQFLESCPGLKHLCIQRMTGLHPFDVPKQVPACMLANLTTIKISKCQGMEAKMHFIKYMLGNAKVLKTVTFISDFRFIENEKLLCAQLLELTRASRFCDFHFIGSKWQFYL